MGRPKGKIVIDKNDLVGKRFDKLEVIRYASNRYEMTLGGSRMRHYYLCKCDCGTEKLIRRGQLTSKIVKSCGCLKRRVRNGN